MTNFSNWSGPVPMVLLAIIVGLGFVYYDSQQNTRDYQRQITDLLSEVESLRGDVEALQGEVGELNRKITSIEESSVQGVVRDANNAVVEGWQSLMEAVGEELDRAREAFQRQSGGAKPGERDGSGGDDRGENSHGSEPAPESEDVSPNQYSPSENTL